MSGKFIVVFKDSATPEQIQKFEENVDETGGAVLQRFDVIKGIAATLTETQLTSFQSDSIIDYIEPDGVMTTQAQ